METITARKILILIVLFVFGVSASVVYAQETTETAPETEITEEAATTTPTTPRIVSLELLTELKASQAAFEDAQKIVNYVLGKIIVEYQVDIRSEVINIDTGEITPRPTVEQ